ncbi:MULTISPECIES: hypothetical protein [unclassified Roseofilum]|uniref:DUF3024 domain-containing protein n=1 Tax=unclassified Roseofilum TaxID=2620099 RepID=UPI000E8856E7|nr:MULTISPECIES: hypothetical protein [unclassified Roseofilum]MBP0008864.1 hypothetical protein [Roseofilum sp. Belize Diploria]MBP0034913.1 hypothetical protein [Roseofilum sp. Belize BBD 4]HBQ98987.1 hypothetical protein [Cyanobacteria bacterium UBA11691]
MAKKRKKIWVYSPAKLPKPKVPEAEKKLILEKCSQFIESELKPKCITSESNNPFFRLVDIFGKWYRNFFHFYAVYDSLDPDSPKPSFEKRFTRLEYVAPDRFNIAYMRHSVSIESEQLRFFNPINRKLPPDGKFIIDPTQENRSV